jgi:N-acetylmuramoyl-L-alanine amidase
MKHRWAVLAFASLLAATGVPPAQADPKDPPASQTQSAPVRSAPADRAGFAEPAPPRPGPGLRVIVNDTEVSLPAPAQVKNGVAVAPLSRVVEAFGGTTVWDPATRTVAVTGMSGLAVRLTVDSTRATSGTAAWDLPTPPMLKGGSVWAPIAAVLRGIGAYVKEDLDAGIVDAVSQVTGMTWRRAGGGLAISISATGPVRPAGLALKNPDRVVVDLTSAVTRLQVPEAALQSEGVMHVRTAQFHVRPYVTRLVFDLARPLAFRIGTPFANAVLVALGNAPIPPSATAPPVHEAAPPASTAASPPGTHPSNAPSGSQPPAGGGDRSAVPVAAQPQSTSGSGDSIAPEPLALPPLSEFVDRPGAFHVGGVTYDERDGVGQLTVRASQPFKYTVHQFMYPDRVAIDVTGGVFLDRRQDLEIGSPNVRNIVVSQFQLAPNLTRVLIHLNRKTPFTALPTDSGRGLVVLLGDTAQRPPRGTAVVTDPRLAGADGGAGPPVAVIDPGHGGADRGATGSTGLREADVALSIARMAREALERQGILVGMTRTDDSTVPLEDRPDLAQRYKGLVFVSIHANASTDPKANGTETYFKTPESRPLAALIESEVVQALGEPDRGVRIADFYVLVNTPMPSALVEVAFISNPAEEALLRDPAAQRRIGEAIARAIVKFLAAQRTLAP